MIELIVEYLDNNNITFYLYKLKKSSEREIIANITSPLALKDAVNNLDSSIY
jgi:hypothetical protein